MVSAFDEVKQMYVTEEELASLLGVESKRVRDLRSYHLQGKQRFINHIKPTSKCILYEKQEVIGWLKDQKVYSFGIAKTSPDKKSETLGNFDINDNKD
jgi:hypothetical protein